MAWLGDLFARERRVKAQQRELEQLKTELHQLRTQNKSMREGMRRCVTCEYRLGAKD